MGLLSGGMPLCDTVLHVLSCKGPLSITQADLGAPYIASIQSMLRKHGRMRENSGFRQRH